MTRSSELNSALGALYGLAIGDALGMPTQLLSPEDVDRRFGMITWFQPAPDDHPIAAGLPAGHITDDTEQALLIARLLIDGHGRIDPHTLANADASGVTHNTTLALSGASAVAAAVSAGVGGASLDGAIQVGLSAARAGRNHGAWVAGADVAARIEAALDGVRGLASDELVQFIRNVVGTSVATQESVPAAFAVLQATQEAGAWEACLLAASLGGDSDTIAAMAGAIAGACQGIGAFPADALDLIRTVNKLELEPIAEQLLRLRRMD